MDVFSDGKAIGKPNISHNLMHINHHKSSNISIYSQDIPLKVTTTYFPIIFRALPNLGIPNPQLDEAQLITTDHHGLVGRPAHGFDARVVRLHHVLGMELQTSAPVF